LDIPNACNGRTADRPRLDDERTNELEGPNSINYIHDPIFLSTIILSGCGFGLEPNNIEWQKCLGGSGNEFAYSLNQTTDGGYVVAGYSNSNDGNVRGNHGGYDFWVAKSSVPTILFNG